VHVETSAQTAHRGAQPGMGNTAKDSSQKDTGGERWNENPLETGLILTFPGGFNQGFAPSASPRDRESRCRSLLGPPKGEVNPGICPVCFSYTRGYSPVCLSYYPVGREVSLMYTR